MLTDVNGNADGRADDIVNAVDDACIGDKRNARLDTDKRERPATRASHKFLRKLFADRDTSTKTSLRCCLLITCTSALKSKKKMKDTLINLHDKLILRKCTITDTVNYELKNVCRNRIRQTPQFRQLRNQSARQPHYIQTRTKENCNEYSNH